jgi:hypothetical protein
MTDHTDTPDGQQPAEPLSRVDTQLTETLRRLKAEARTQTLRDLVEPVGEWLAWRGDDLRRAVTGGWSQTDTWIKASLGGVALLGAAAVGGTLLSLTLQGLADAAHVAADAIPGGSARRTGLLASITSPVWAYLRSHTQGLAIDARTAYGTWVLAVPVTGFLSFATKKFSARLAWALTGAATGWMVWNGAPAAGREVALGITVLAWSLLSIAALRGFRIGREQHLHSHVDVNVDATQPTADRHW